MQSQAKPSAYPRSYWLNGSLAALLLWCTALILIRVFWSGRITYLFLIWNLALAVVPYALAVVLRRAEARRASGLVLAALGLSWLLFFPNAPYVLTDLLHLKPKPEVPLWYDLVLLLSCGGTALSLGFLSLADVQAVTERRLGWRGGWLVALTSLWLSGFGIYLGRYQRWNSWDILTRPTMLLTDIAHRFLHPLQHPRTWGVTLLFGGLFTLAYVLARVVQLGEARLEER